MMSPISNRAVAVLLATILGVLMGSTSYGAPPDSTAWSKTLQPANRFSLVLNDEAVLDKETGLVWERSPDPTLRTWYGDVYECTKKVVGGRMGWRLPTVEELASLLDPAQTDPSLPPGHPFIGVGNVYYTMTTNAEAEIRSLSNYAWAVGFFDPYTGPSLPPGKTIEIPAWCVRGGHGYGGYPNVAYP